MQHCAGAEALTQRELLRWWLRGRPVTDFGSLRNADAIRAVVATIVGDDVYREGQYLVTVGVSLEPDGNDRLRPFLQGSPLPFAAICRQAHPSVPDPTVGADEVVARLDVGEKTVFEALEVGQDWDRASGCWVTRSGAAAVD